MTHLPGADGYACDDVGGWFDSVDVALFDAILSHQLDADIGGDLLEICVFHGKSAILLGYGLREGETLIACDLFHEVLKHAHIPDHAQVDVHADDFLANWDRYHDRRPDVLQCESADLRLDRPLRFIHIDGCHSYECVTGDIARAARHTRTTGVIVVDDYRTAHVPGVAAAVWEAVNRGDIHPFATTNMKLYAATNAVQQRRWFDVVKARGHTYAFPDYDVAVIP